MKLEIELIPKKSWGRNCRTILKQKQWDKIRRYMYWKKKYKCEICKSKKNKKPVECHEVWSYDDNKRIQKLEKLEVLCNTCHKVKHIGRTIHSKNYSKRAKKNYKKVMKHFININKISERKAIRKINEAFEVQRHRNLIRYKINIKLAKKLLKKI